MGSPRHALGVQNCKSDGETVIVQFEKTFFQYSKLILDQTLWTWKEFFSSENLIVPLADPSLFNLLQVKEYQLLSFTTEVL